MHHHRQASAVSRAVSRALAPVVVRRRSCGKRWYADRIAADLALALIRSRGRALGKDPVRSYSCPTCDGWHLTAIAVWRSGPHIPQQRNSSSNGDRAGRHGSDGRRPGDRRHPRALPRCPGSAL